MSALSCPILIEFMGRSEGSSMWLEIGDPGAHLQLSGHIAPSEMQPSAMSRKRRMWLIVICFQRELFRWRTLGA
eukprot:6722931-Alexandrium_andersonii.AAC.1